MADCDVGCTGQKPEEALASMDRVEYKSQAEDVKEEIKEDVPPLVNILGAQLLNEDGNVATTKLIQKQVIGLYFSAEWCQPCHRFTPVLTEAYTKLKKEDSTSLEIVFISSDRNESDYEKHWKTMPWLALPYAKRIKKGTLSRMFDVQDIPRLVLIDPKTGQVTNRGAKHDVINDKAIENFPWTNPRARTILEFVSNATILLKTSSEVALSDMRERFLILFFCAGWCDACQRFLPTIREWYKKFHPKLQ